ncbi:MAG: hypothetical protein GXY52_07870 [Chloroflexi bacterium]|nr:hypothetical protein [Chloroflexota bacterium]
MATAHISAGVCSFNTTVHAVADDMYQVEIKIKSDCAKIMCLAQSLKSVDALQEISQPLLETTVYQTAARCKLHAACPIPSGIIKAIEVAAGLALPADVSIGITAD